jgi:hypothetical protein
MRRWLTRSDADAADVVQEAYQRAFRYFDSYRDGDADRLLQAEAIYTLIYATECERDHIKIGAIVYPTQRKPPVKAGRSVKATIQSARVSVRARIIGQSLCY